MVSIQILGPTKNRSPPQLAKTSKPTNLAPFGLDKLICHKVRSPEFPKSRYPSRTHHHTYTVCLSICFLEQDSCSRLIDLIKINAIYIKPSTMPNFFLKRKCVSEKAPLTLTQEEGTRRVNPSFASVYLPNSSICEAITFEKNKNLEKGWSRDIRNPTVERLSILLPGQNGDFSRHVMLEEERCDSGFWGARDEVIVAGF